MLVEEGSIPHALMLCGPSGSKTAHRFCRNGRREAKPATVFCRNDRREAKPATVFCRNERRGAKPSTFFAEIGVRKQNRPRFLQK